MKINIENYENLTPEEKLAAWEAFDPEKNGFIQKATFDKTASELAAAKKRERDRMTEDEAKAAREAEEKANLLARVEELEHEKKVGSYVSSFLTMGYDEKLAKSSAEALAKGEMETVFKNLKTHADTREKELRTEILKQTPPPAAGTGGNGVKTKEDFLKMNLQEKQQFAKENPEQYAEFYK